MAASMVCQKQYGVTARMFEYSVGLLYLIVGLYRYNVLHSSYAKVPHYVTP